MSRNPLINFLISLVLALLFIILAWIGVTALEGFNAILLLGIIFLFYIIATIYIYQNSLLMPYNGAVNEEIKNIMKEVEKESEALIGAEKKIQKVLKEKKTGRKRK